MRKEYTLGTRCQAQIGLTCEILFVNEYGERLIRRTSVILRQWMDQKSFGILQISKELKVSPHTVKKWLRCGQKDGRTPRPAMQARIREFTQGAVQPNDWVSG
jgi:hypothetical protein